MTVFERFGFGAFLFKAVVGQERSHGQSKQIDVAAKLDDGFRVRVLRQRVCTRQPFQARSGLAFEHRRSGDFGRDGELLMYGLQLNDVVAGRAC